MSFPSSLLLLFYILPPATRYPPPAFSIARQTASG